MGVGVLVGVLVGVRVFVGVRVLVGVRVFVGVFEGVGVPHKGTLFPLVATSITLPSRCQESAVLSVTLKAKEFSPGWKTVGWPRSIGFGVK